MLVTESGEDEHSKVFVLGMVVTVRRWTQARRNRPEKVIRRHINIDSIQVDDFNSGEISKDFIGSAKGAETILIVDDLRWWKSNDKEGINKKKSLKNFLLQLKSFPNGFFYHLLTTSPNLHRFHGAYLVSASQRLPFDL